MLNIANDHGAITKPFKVKQKKEYTGRIRWYSADEITSMEVYFADDRDFLDLAHLALDTGFRYGELIKLTPRDYSASTGRLSTWVTKGERQQNVGEEIPFISRDSHMDAITLYKP